MLLPLAASADPVEIDGIWYNLVTRAKTAEVTSMPSGKYTGDVIIPATVSYEGVDYDVLTIGEKAFYWCTGLTSVTIPNSVTSIVDDAFSHCSGLTSVTIPNSVTNIGNRAFEVCTGLTSVTIPNSVTSIGWSAFLYCTGLTSLTIPNSVTSIESYAFSGCTSLTFVTIPNSVTSIGDDAFYGCTGLTSLTIPNSVTSIGNNAFYGCTGLTSVIIGSGVTSIGSWAFAKCPELADVYCLAEAVPSANSDAFEDSYPELSTLHVPAASIGEYRNQEPWSKFKEIVSIKAGDIPEEEGADDPQDDPEDAPVITQAEIQLGATKMMAGYSFGETLDFSGVTNGKAWIAAGFVGGSKVMLMRVNVVPANTGIIVTSDTPGAKITVPVSSERAYYTNMLVPILEKQTIYPTQNIDGVQYTFMGVGTISGTSQTGFVKIGASQSYGPNKSLLRVPTEYLSTAARSLDELEVVFDETAAIRNMQGATEQSAAIYNLQGQRMSKPMKGLYIKNGKKYVR